MTRPFRRLVLYLPGFDPFPPRRYRELYRREAAAQAGVSGYGMTVAGAKIASGFGWRSRGSFPEGEAETLFEVLVWSDLVQASMRTAIAGTYLQLARTAAIYIGSGAFGRLMRLRRGPMLAALYPFAILLLQLLVALIVGAAAGWLAAWAFNGWAGLIVAAAMAVAVLMLARAQDHRLYAYYLMNDYAFTAALRGAYPEALEERIRGFTARLEQALQDPEIDEVLVVGHSSGAYLAVSILADLIRGGLPPSRATLSLLTLGHVVPMASFLPDATRLRADLAYLSERSELFWLDVTAPGDACSFALCDPVAVTGVAGEGQLWPLVISASFTNTLSPEKQRELRKRWFRLHFQYLCAFDRPGDYDYFAITGGPLTLAQRFAGRKPSPGRITRAVGPGLP
ncbi:hypothetical protein JJJ17_15390 [Paracoccus caeni]|uniref:Uncharacterized protein n=1 Tax=Paracoccus caeni TaxID=657651 RepID=A0A934SGQ8_9RHOB|nr:hypothetical protein [Paracoccus caeni]MBK4217313.1 hypothetical protein [Paracoccus caeni]